MPPGLGLPLVSYDLRVIPTPLCGDEAAFLQNEGDTGGKKASAVVHRTIRRQTPGRCRSTRTELRHAKPPGAMTTGLLDGTAMEMPTLPVNEGPDSLTAFEKGVGPEENHQGHGSFWKPAIHAVAKQCQQ